MNLEGFWGKIWDFLDLLEYKNIIVLSGGF